jgi:hypothetical protein
VRSFLSSPLIVLGKRLKLTRNVHRQCEIQYDLLWWKTGRVVVSDHAGSTWRRFLTLLTADFARGVATMLQVKQ